MPRRMSCALTVDAVLERTKRVTRRRAETWQTLKVGDRLTLIEKGMGLQKGETQRVLAEVEITAVTVEALGERLAGDLAAEGFPNMTEAEFAEMWCRSHDLGALPEAERSTVPVRRIAWQYLGACDCCERWVSSGQWATAGAAFVCDSCCAELDPSRAAGARRISTAEPEVPSPAKPDASFVDEVRRLVPAPVVFAIGGRTRNDDAIAACAVLRYLRTNWSTLDATYGSGRFWRVWRPSELTAADKYTGGRVIDGQTVHAWDFTALPVADRSFDAVVFDPPYKLNGTSTGKGAASSDLSYGVHRSATWQERHALIAEGIAEACRVARKTVLVKCQDQVCSGAVRWQTYEFAAAAEACIGADGRGWRLTDALFVTGSRKQPASQPCRRCAGAGAGVRANEDGSRPVCEACSGSGLKIRAQVHARRDYSTLLVFTSYRVPVVGPEPVVEPVVESPGQP